MDAAIDEVAEDVPGSPEGQPHELEEEPEPVEYITIRIPVKHIKGIHTVKEQKARWTPRQARAQRLIYDGMSYAGAELSGPQTLKIGTTAPLWYATAWLLDKVADEFGMAPSSLDTLL